MLSLKQFYTQKYLFSETGCSMSEKDTLEEASDGSDAAGDEVNQKVVRVMAPLLKKIQRQTKRVSALEENVQQRGQSGLLAGPHQATTGSSGCV